MIQLVSLILWYVSILHKESIIVGANLIRDFLPKDLPLATPKTSKYVVITDTSVHRLHFGRLLEGLHAAGITSDRVSTHSDPHFNMRKGGEVKKMRKKNEGDERKKNLSP